MQTGGIGPGLVRLLQAAQTELVAELFTPGRVLEADVVSVFQDRAVLAFGRGLRLEVSLQADLKEGQRVRVQVQARTGPEAGAAQPGTPQPGAPQPGTAQPATPQPATPQSVILKLLTSADGQNPQIQGQTTPVTAHPQPETPGVFWLPVPLPDGRQGWAQLQVREEPEGPARSRTHKSPHQVRIWWETPELGQVQVALDGAVGGALAAIFTVPGAESRIQVEEGLPALKQRLAGAGFPEARVGCRPPRPGESVGPAPAGGASRLDQRL